MVCVCWCVGHGMCMLVCWSWYVYAGELVMSRPTFLIFSSRQKLVTKPFFSSTKSHLPAFFLGSSVSRNELSSQTNNALDGLVQTSEESRIPPEMLN
ncbi:hypothetical protein CEXT_293641 [Caerostris extrusa]|uniref:Secreted protein n=1 Tax=Caerostris extrusa TaxID=172846 RepID=A0AAV4MTR9_CAEEX|nr:hypothetical protein CEXT_293641 [Caerostris extrusa]